MLILYPAEFKGRGWEEEGGFGVIRYHSKGSVFGFGRLGFYLFICVDWGAGVCVFLSRLQVLNWKLGGICLYIQLFKK